MKLYVGNLPFQMNEAEVREVFEPFEPVVDCHVPLDRETGNPRGFAFVTLSSRESGEKAIEALDGSDVGGRNIRVSEAEERRNTGGGGGGGGGYGGGGGGYGGGEGGGGGGPKGKYRKEKSQGHGDKGSGKRYRSI